MCNQATTEICDNLAALAIASLVEPAFSDWLADVQHELCNKSAIGRKSKRSLRNAYDDGFSPAYVARALDRYYEMFQPKLFTAEKMT